MGFTFLEASNATGDSSFYPAVLGGWAYSSSRPTGIYGFTNVSAGSGITGASNSVGSPGVQAIQITGAGTALTASGGATGAMISGSGEALITNGVNGANTNGSRYGTIADGGRASLLVSGSRPAPPSRSDMHEAGELDTSRVLPFSDKELWFCVESGSPGDWRKLAGPETAGAFHAIAPARGYDSRRPTPLPGAISSGSNRVVSVKDGRVAASGAVDLADVVPAGARAVAYNVTIAETVGTGFLSVTPGDTASSEASSINWSASGLILANAGIVKLDDNRSIKVFCGGGGATQFLIDVTGYFL